MSRETLADFTEAERNTITDLHRRNFENITPEEAILYGEWMAVNSKLETIAGEQVNAIRQLAEKDLQLKQQAEQASIDALKALEAEAIERLKAVQNGQA